jgi:hypothetical protein
MKAGKLKVRRVFREKSNPYRSNKNQQDLTNTKTLLSNAHAPNIVCELNPSPEPMKHYKPVLASRQSWMKSLDKATATHKMHRSAQSFSPASTMKTRNKDRIVLNKSQNLVTFDEKKPLDKEEANNLF